jgi:CubicO group peptidase (beta-lactamase class C family)
VVLTAAAAVGPDGVRDAAGPTRQPFALASVTKVLSALAVLVAVEEGSVSLDEPAGPPGSTVRHLLAHASGLGPDTAEVVAAPGTRRIYSNAGFEVLAGHVERATGFSFAGYLTEAVLAPLGMHSTVLEGSAAHGAVSSCDDLARLASELLTPSLVAPATMAAATAVQLPGLAGVLPGFGRQDPNDWGLGFELRDGKQPHWTGATNSPATFGHFGRSGTFCWVDPGARVALVVLTDRPFGPWAAEAWPVLADAVLADHR